MASTLTAKFDRETGDFNLFDNGFKFGRLANCECAYVFLSDDEELEGYVVDRIEGGMSVREMLAAVRVGYDAFCKFNSDVSRAEQAAENAWLHHAERYDPEAQQDLRLHDSLHPYGYCN